MSTQHKDITGDDAIHPIMYVTGSDPGAVGANKFWLDTTGGATMTAGAILKQRDGSNASWTTRADVKTALDLKAALASPTFTGTPAGPTAAPGTNTTQFATTAFVAAAVAAAAGVTDLDDLADVNAPTPSDGDVLTWDATPGEWVASAPTGGSNALDDLTDVNAPTPADGDVLTWDDGAGEWVPAAGGGGGISGLTTNYIPKASSSSAIADSIINQSSSTTLIFGGPDTNATPVAVVHRHTNATGSDVAGSDATFIGSRATGNAASGKIIFQTGAVGSSGTTLQTATTRIVIGPARVEIPGSGTQSVCIGVASDNNTVASSQDAIAIGRNAKATTQYGTIAIGGDVTASNYRAVCIGTASTCAQDGGVVIGYTSGSTSGTGTGPVSIGSAGTIAGGTGAVALGRAATTGHSAQAALALGYGASAQFDNAIAMGQDAICSKTHQMVIGGSNGYISEVVIGQNETSNGGRAVLMRFTNGSGTNNAGSDTTFQASLASGNAANGSFIFTTGDVGSTGTTTATATTKFKITGPGSILCGKQAALSTSATDGFIYIPTCAGTPTGTPTSVTGLCALVFDTTNNKLAVYNGAWKQTAALT